MKPRLPNQIIFDASSKLSLPSLCNQTDSKLGERVESGSSQRAVHEAESLALAPLVFLPFLPYQEPPECSGKKSAPSLRAIPHEHGAGVALEISGSL